MDVNSIIVVGGGTSGCISALILKKQFPHLDISIVESKDVGIVGVGESSTEHWSNFCEFVDINILDAVLHCNATFKSGVYFENWSNKDFIHSIESPYNETHNDYYYQLAYSIVNDKPPVDFYSTVNELSILDFNDLNDSPYHQFHFDTFALNKYLHDVCISRDIKVIQDDLTGVNLNTENGTLKEVFSESNNYIADFFIDCSGFARLLLGQIYEIPWVSYSDYLPLNSAISFATDEMDEYNKYTKATARNAGWSWTIPTQTRTGNGYVYCDSFIDENEAQDEMENAYGKTLEVSRQFKFDPGRLEKAWHKNCYAVGLSQSFVEPLEATSIGSIIQQMFCFINFLPSYDEESCNENVNKIFDNIVDYIQAHYLVKKENTPFWKEVKYNLKLTSALESYLNKWKNRLPLSSDIRCSWGLFESINYIQILHGLEWFDYDKIKKEYQFYKVEEDLNLSDIKPFSISHKKFIKEILNARHTQNNTE